VALLKWVVGVKYVVLLRFFGVKYLLFVLGNGAVVILVIFVVPKDPKAKCMIPESLDEGAFTRLHCLGANSFEIRPLRKLCQPMFV
jgi:hypothetical protein